MKICIVCAPRGVGRGVRRCGKVDLHIYLHRSVCWLTHCQTCFLSGCQTDRLTCFLACWLIWLAYPSYWQNDLLPPWLTRFSSTLTDPSNWALILTVSQFFFGWRRWLTSGCLPFWLTHPAKLSYRHSVSVLLWLTSLTDNWLSSCLFDPSNRALLLTECLASSVADLTDWIASACLIALTRSFPVWLTRLAEIKNLSLKTR